MFWLMCLTALVSGVLGRDQFVINGQPVDDDTKWPWQGSMKFSDGSHICGCVLVHADWALTAAHCFSATFSGVEFGSVMLGEGQSVSIDSFVTHPEFNEGPGAFPNDVAVVRVSGVVEGPTVQPIALSTGADITQSECWITGWGSVDFDTEEGTFPEQLHEAQIPVLDSPSCEEKLEDSYYERAHICAWDETEEVAACHADAGGPLVCSTDGLWRLEGVFSFGYAGCDTTYPSVYARVSSYLDWICEESQGNVC